MMMCSMILENQMTRIVYSLSKQVKLIFKFFFPLEFYMFFSYCKVLIQNNCFSRVLMKIYTKRQIIFKIVS